MTTILIFQNFDEKKSLPLEKYFFVFYVNYPTIFVLGGHI